MPKVINETVVRTEQQLADGTIELQEEPVFVYVHCYNSGCTHYHNLQAGLDFEERVPGVRQETLYTYSDRGGDMPGHENSHVSWFPADPTDATCDECGQARNVSPMGSYVLQQYGVGPGTGLKGAERAAAIAVEQASRVDAGLRVESDAKIAALTAQVEKLAKLVVEGKRPPGRPKGSKNKPKPDPVAEALEPEFPDDADVREVHIPYKE